MGHGADQIEADEVGSARPPEPGEIVVHERACREYEAFFAVPLRSIHTTG